MALVKCKECDKEISDSAKSCPNCGKKLGGSNFFKIVIMLIALGFITTSISQCSEDSQRKELEKEDKVYLESLTPEKRAAELKTRDEIKKIEEIQKLAESKRSALAFSALKSVRDGVIDKDSLKIESISINDKATVACVSYRAKNAYGGYLKGYAAFVNGKASDSPEVWNANCAGKKLYDYTSYGRIK